MARRATNNAGDLLRAARDLGVHDPALLQRLARQLGLQVPPAPRAAAASPAGAARAASPKRPQPAQALPPARPQPGPQADSPGGDTAAAGSLVPAQLLALPDLPAGAAAPAWLAPDTPQLAKGPVAPATPHDTLFSPPSSRAMGAALAAVRIRDGDVDTERLVATLAEGRPLRTVPRLPVWTLRHGLQVLIDQGPGMQPWQRDVDQLLALLARLLGEARLQVLGFDDEPLRGCWQPGTDETMRWPAPPPGAAVLMVSDLGITRPPGAVLQPVARRWQGFARAAAQAGAAVRVLVPHAPARWPADLPAPLRPLWWDRHTTVAAVRRLLAA
jgi:hypothetical protein